MFVWEIYTDDAAFDKGKGDKHGLDLVIYFGPGLVAGIIGGHPEVILLGAALRAWFDPLLNLKRGDGFWHLGTVSAWDKFLRHFSRAGQLTIRIVLTALAVSLWWWWEVLWAMSKLLWGKLF